MRHPVEDKIAILHRKHRAQIALAQSKRARLAGERPHVRVAVVRGLGNLLEPSQQPFRFLFGQTGQLLDYAWRDNQGHAERSPIASALSSRPYQLIDFAA